MEKKDAFTKILAIGGTILVLLPILLPLVFSIISILSDGIFRFDYLMPVELFPIAFVGGGLLTWAALRARSYRKLIGWGLGTAIGLLVGSQVLAVVTGLATGETKPGGLWWAIVVGALAVYSISLLIIGIGGGLLLRDLFGTPRLRRG